jgi:very-short-patch-repair endonuclease
MMRVPDDFSAEVARAMTEDGATNKSAYWRHAMRQFLNARRVRVQVVGHLGQAEGTTSEAAG